MEIAKLILEYLKVLAWPSTAIFLSIYFRKSLVAILARLETATLPGGIELGFKHQLKQIEAISEKVSASPEQKQLANTAKIETTDANKRLIELALTPVPSDLSIGYFEQLADDEPSLAIAAIRMEIETLAKNLIIACKLPIATDQSALTVIRELTTNNVLKDYQSNLALEIVQLSNMVIHGRKISRDSVSKVLKGVAILYRDYQVWLSGK